MRLPSCLRSVFQVGLLRSPERTRPSPRFLRVPRSFCRCLLGYHGRRQLFHGISYRRDLEGQGQYHNRLLHISSNRLQESSSSNDKHPSLEWLHSGKEFLNGPDQVIPTKAISTWNIQGAVALSKLGKEPGVSNPPISVPTLFQRQVQRAPNIPAIAVKRDGNWQKWTYEDYFEDCRKCAKAFIALGLQRFHSVCILGFNSPEWFISNMGAIFAGGIPSGIYTTNSAEACAYIAEDSRANIYIVEDEQQLSKVLQYRGKLTHLKAIVQYRGSPGCDGVLSWKELMELGANQSDEELDKRLKQMAVNQCCTLIYTSGTTGKPKGVMLSHDNLTWLAMECAIHSAFDSGVQETVSFLPLSHIAAQHADMYLPLATSGTVYFADPDALKGTLIHTLVEIQPTVFLAVPRVWEKFYEKLMEIRSKNKGIKMKIGDWAKNQAVEYHKRRREGHPCPETFQFKLADKLILSKVKHALGLSRCHLCTSAAAPINVGILEYFMSLNVVVGEAYGLSESSGPHTLSLPEKNLVKFGSIGPPVGNVATKLDNVGADGQGEICLGGRHVLMGYLGKEEKTRKAVDKEGWLHSEDVGRIDKDGFLWVTGRLKELLITAGGENVAPVPLEENIKSALPCLSNCMVIGDKLKFLSALITLKTEMNPQTNEPLEKLTESTKDWVEKHGGGCVVNTVKDVLAEVYQKNNSKLINSLTAGVMLANSKSVSRASKVRKWVILPKDFSIPGGELGPTLKLKRSVTIEKYKDLVDEIYKDGLDPNSTGVLG